MSKFTVIITEPTRAAKWNAIISTTAIPVTSDKPETLRCGSKLTSAYRIDLDALTEAQRARLATRNSLDWEMTIEDAAQFMEQHGLYIMQDHCTQPQAAPAAADAPRIERRGEIQVSPDDAPDTCDSCGKPIMWHRLGPGRAIPLSVATLEQDAGGRRYALSHFTDCPNAKQHSGKSRADYRKAKRPAPTARR